MITNNFPVVKRDIFCFDMSMIAEHNCMNIIAVWLNKQPYFMKTQNYKQYTSCVLMADILFYLNNFQILRLESRYNDTVCLETSSSVCDIRLYLTKLIRLKV